MAGKKSVRGTYPKHLKPMQGRGIIECEASGFLRKPERVAEDVRQGVVAHRFADITPGFGTYHPQDLRALGNLDDPSPVYKGRPMDERNLSKQDLGISDREVELSIREGREPRRGY